MFQNLQKHFSYTNNKQIDRKKWDDNRKQIERQRYEETRKREWMIRKMKQEPELPPLKEEEEPQKEEPQTIVLPELTFEEYNQCLMMEEYTYEADYYMEEEKGPEFAVFNLNGKEEKSYFFLMEYFCSFSEMTELDIMTQPKKEYRYFCYRYLNYMRNIALPVIKKNEIWEAVLIEYRKFPHLEFLIRNMIYRLGKRWSHTVVCGSYNYLFMKKMCGRIDKNIKVIKTNVADLKTPSEYSSFLSGLYFWNLLNGKKILIYQEDTCIFKKNIRDFMEFDYIGAPWRKDQDDNINHVGNGGFSLRTKQCMIDVIDRISITETTYYSSTWEYIRNTNSTIPPEDVYFTKNMLDFKIGKVADWDTAYQFSSESYHNPNSLGGHNFWLDDVEWKQRLHRHVVVQVRPNYEEVFKMIEHRGGWGFVLENLIGSDFFNKEASIEFYDVADFSIHKIKEKSQQGVKWAGIFHLTPKTPENFDALNIQHILEDDEFIVSLRQCLFIVTLSSYLTKHMKECLYGLSNVPIYTIKHPVVTENIPQFDWEAYRSNPEKKLIQIGQQLRKVTSIYTLKNLPSSFEKMWLTGLKDFERCKRMLEDESKMLGIKNIRLDEVKMHYTQTFEEYDELLTKNVVFVEVFDATANNTLLECLVRNTPLIINKVGGIPEYLGEDYPLYFTSLNEVPEMLREERLLEAHEYLKKKNKKDLEVDVFKKKLFTILQENVNR